MQSESTLQQILMNAHVPEYQYQVINTYSHDIHSFTEGLFFKMELCMKVPDCMEQSRLHKMEMNTGKILKEYTLSQGYFGEGITVLREQLYQLTYREHTGFIYDKNSLQFKNTFSYPHQGWGLTTDGQQLIMSNGSYTLSWLDPLSLKSMQSIPVTVNDEKINSINELEYINGMIYANVWPTSIILVISPQNGKSARLDKYQIIKSVQAALIVWRMALRIMSG